MNLRFCGLIFILPLVNLYSQSETQIDGILGKKHVDFGPAVHLVFEAAGLMESGGNEMKALEILTAKAWMRLPQAGIPITWGEYSLLLIKSFELNTGLIFYLFPIPRYAAREADFLKFLPYGKKPDSLVTPRELLLCLAKAMEMSSRGGQK